MASLINDIKFNIVAKNPEPTVENILENPSIRWIIVSGKGGTGKTTCSCCIAILLAQVRDSVLLISTDLAHNLSDAFNQKFTSTPSQVVGINNLYAMEIDTNFSYFTHLMNDTNGANGFLNDVLSSLPGIEEVMAHMSVVHMLEEMKYSVIVFDTAATGHTLQLLQLPNDLEKFFERAVSLKRRFGSIFDQMSIFFGFAQNGGISAVTEKKISEVLDELRIVIGKFRDENHTSFVCVCLADKLCVNETERLVENLKNLSLNINNIIVNQLVFEDSDCRLCKNRKSMQTKFLAIICEQYRDYHIIKLPLIDHELKTDELHSLSKLFIKPFQQ